MKKNTVCRFLAGIIIVSAGLFVVMTHQRSTKLLWFIPDGVRGDWLFQFAEEGYLPNIKKMMDKGVYAYSIPAFPSHTPTNYATLRTGCYPDVHGVSDGPVRAPGALLTKPIPGFSSLASRTPAIWDILDKNNKEVVVLSVPGSTPPTLKKGITIRGRWAGWGVETPPLLFTTDVLGSGIRSMAGFDLKKRIAIGEARGWKNMPASYDAVPREIKLSAHDIDLYGYVYDSKDDKKVQYDSIVISQDKNAFMAVLSAGKWSEWIPLVLKQAKGDIRSHVKIKIIDLSDDGKNIRVRFCFDSLNRTLVEPPAVYDELVSSDAGPSIDYVDDWPHQLVEEKDYDTFKEESDMSLEWHRKAVSALLKKYKPDAVIHSIYTPNQFLEAPFWMGHVDATNKRVFSPAEKSKYWNEIINLYKGLDAIVGKYLEYADKNTIIVFSSDHGIAPLHRMVLLNNLFAKKGWLKYTVDVNTGKAVVDWERSKVIFLKMAYIYISPRGFGKNGAWERAGGNEYELLRNEVMKSLESLQDGDNSKPLNFSIKWEEADTLHLPKDRVGDIIISARPPYAWSEDIIPNQGLFMDSKDTGYKQTVDPTDKNIQTPFIIMGPGVKEGIRINPIHHVDQMPTLLYLMGIKRADYVQGRVLQELLRQKNK